MLLYVNLKGRPDTVTQAMKDAGVECHCSMDDGLLVILVWAKDRSANLEKCLDLLIGLENELGMFWSYDDVEARAGKTIY
jgi:hypothetical protein